jgi:hypothetical protein
LVRIFCSRVGLSTQKPRLVIPSCSGGGWPSRKAAPCVGGFGLSHCAGRSAPIPNGASVRLRLLQRLRRSGALTVQLLKHARSLARGRQFQDHRCPAPRTNRPPNLSHSCNLRLPNL